MSCPTIKKKLQGILKSKTNKTNKQKTPKYEATDQESEADMAGVLNLSVQKLKTILINMLRVVMDKVDIMQKQRDNVSWEMEILRKRKSNF